jgi:hypothetical protein
LIRPAVDPLEFAMQCPRCGAELDTDAAFCSRCGQAVRGQAAHGQATRSYRSVSEQFSEFQRRLPGPLATVPLELLAAVALMVASAPWLGVTVALHVHDVADLFGDSAFGGKLPGLALAVLATLIVLLAFAVWLIYLAWRLTERDSLSRAVAFVPLVGYGLAVLFSSAREEGSGGTFFALHSIDSHGPMPILTMLMCWAAAVLLAAAPGIRGFFGVVRGEQSRLAAIPAARILLTIFAGGIACVGVLYLVAHLIAKPYEDSIGVKLMVIGILFIAVAAGIIAMLARLVGGDPMARLLITGLVLAYLILMALIAGQDLALLILLFIGAGAVAYLWLAPTARIHFAAPVPVATRPYPTQAPGAAAPPYGTAPPYGSAPPAPPAGPEA